jgi:hypothetical protein
MLKRASSVLSTFEVMVGIFLLKESLPVNLPSDLSVRWR